MSQVGWADPHNGHLSGKTPCSTADKDPKCSLVLRDWTGTQSEHKAELCVREGEQGRGSTHAHARREESARGTRGSKNHGKYLDSKMQLILQFVVAKNRWMVLGGQYTHMSCTHTHTHTQ